MRSDIAERLAAHSEERRRLQEIERKNTVELEAHDASLWTETKKMFGRVERRKAQPDAQHRVKSLQLLTFSKQLSEEQLANAEDVQALEFEIHVRDSPDLVKQLGPGAD